MSLDSKCPRLGSRLSLQVQFNTLSLSLNHDGPPTQFHDHFKAPDKYYLDLMTVFIWKVSQFWPNVKTVYIKIII